VKTVLLFLCLVVIGDQRMPAQKAHVYPLVLRLDAPVYPPLARVARVQGRVQATFTVKGGAVLDVEAKSGRPLLVDATIKNIKSWCFSPDAEGTFTTTFEYRIKGRAAWTGENPVLEMQLPGLVRITVTPLPPIT
jgi:hypothetical protein